MEIFKLNQTAFVIFFFAGVSKINRRVSLKATPGNNVFNLSNLTDSFIVLSILSFIHSFLPSCYLILCPSTNIETHQTPQNLQLEYFRRIKKHYAKKSTFRKIYFGNSSSII